MRSLAHSCFLLLLLERLSELAFRLLLGTCLSSLWSPLFSFPCPCYVPNLFPQGAALAHLDFLTSHNLVIWTDGSVPLASLPTALSVALRLPFTFWQAQFVQDFPLKPAPFSKLFAGFGSTNKSATFFLLLCLYLYLKLSGRYGRNGLLSLPILSGCNGSPNTCFSRGTTRLISWSNREPTHTP